MPPGRPNFAHMDSTLPIGSRHTTTSYGSTAAISGRQLKLLARAVVDGIRLVDAGVLHTFHCSRGCSALLYWGTSEPWLTVNNIYTSNDNVVSNAFRGVCALDDAFFPH